MDSSFNYMNPSQLERVIHSIPDLHIRRWKDRDVVYLFKNLYWLGLRPVEGIRLCKENFSFNDNRVRLGQTKTERQGIAFIPPPYRVDLESYISTKRPGRLLPGLEYNTFYVWLKRLGKINNIEAWTMPQSETGEKTVGHIFRKSLGKDMLYGLNGRKYEIPVISRQLRHAKISTTQDSYLKANLETVEAAWD